MAIYTAISNPCFYNTLLEDSREGETNWTINKAARPGDLVLLYICAPASAVIGVATVATRPERNEDVNSEWYGHYLADMHSLRILAEQITRNKLLEWYPSWRYWKQPRNSVRVPDGYAKEIRRIVNNDASRAT